VNAHERFDLTGKTALVTGGSRGIGRGIAIGFAQHGANVAIVYRSAEREARKVVAGIQALGRRGWVYRQDLGELGGLPAFAERVWDDCGPVDILVNNAGMAYLEPFSEITVEHWRQVMAVNLDAVFLLTQQIARRMMAAGVKGRIINLSSKNGFVAEAGLAHYNASKGALELLTRSLAIELGAAGITVNTIAPGIIETEIAGEFHLPPQFFDYYKEHIPLEHRFGQVEDCVGAAIFLASPAGGYMTGQHLIIDGGVLCEQVPRMQFMKPRPRGHGG